MSDFSGFEYLIQKEHQNISQRQQQEAQDRSRNALAGTLAETQRIKLLNLGQQAARALLGVPYELSLYQEVITYSGKPARNHFEPIRNRKQVVNRTQLGAGWAVVRIWDLGNDSSEVDRLGGVLLTPDAGLYNYSINLKHHGNEPHTRRLMESGQTLTAAVDSFRQNPTMEPGLPATAYEQMQSNIVRYLVQKGIV